MEVLFPTSPTARSNRLWNALSCVKAAPKAKWRQRVAAVHVLHNCPIEQPTRDVCGTGRPTSALILNLSCPMQQPSTQLNAFSGAGALRHAQGSRGADFRWTRCASLLDALGQPAAAFSSVLIAGTNGKGSTASTLASILTEAGQRTGLYTSPHLEKPNERIRLGPRRDRRRRFCAASTSGCTMRRRSCCCQGACRNCPATLRS